MMRNVLETTRINKFSFCATKGEAHKLLLNFFCQSVCLMSLILWWEGREGRKENASLFVLVSRCSWNHHHFDTTLLDHLFQGLSQRSSSFTSFVSLFISKPIVRVKMSCCDSCDEVVKRPHERRLHLSCWSQDSRVKKVHLSNVVFSSNLGILSPQLQDNYAMRSQTVYQSKSIHELEENLKKFARRMKSASVSLITEINKIINLRGLWFEKVWHSQLKWPWVRVVEGFEDEVIFPADHWQWGRIEKDKMCINGKITLLRGPLSWAFVQENVFRSRHFSGRTFIIHWRRKRQAWEKRHLH